MEVYVTHIDTACMLLEINGFKILTDPTLDAPGKLYHHGFGAFSRKLDQPARTPQQLADVDLVLLSHHQHKDNFDNAGQAFAASMPLIISTKAAQRALPNVTGLDPWQTQTIVSPKVPLLRITATPAQHRPGWVPEFVSGTVIGFIIEYDGQPDGCLYLSGDTVYFRGIAEVARRFRVDVAFFNVGSVQFRYLTGLGRYTMDGNDFLKSAATINANQIIPLHYAGWSHFKESTSHFKRKVGGHESTSGKTTFLERGVRTRLK